MSDTPRVDFGLRSADYAEHRPGLPDSFYGRLERFADVAGARVLDLGTGPGITALELARRGARVTGLDIAEPQIAAARARARELGLEQQARFEVAPAERTGLDEASFDLVTASQCWPWFDNDVAKREVARVLRPGGHLVVAHYCYLPQQSALAAQSEALVLKHNPGWKLGGWDGIYAFQIDGLQSGQLRLVEQFCYDEPRAFTHAAWRGRMRTCNGVGSGGMDDATVATYDAELAQLLAEQYPDEPLPIEHRIWAVVLKRS